MQGCSSRTIPSAVQACGGNSWRCRCVRERFFESASRKMDSFSLSGEQSTLMLLKELVLSSEGANSKRLSEIAFLVVSEEKWIDSNIWEARRFPIAFTKPET